MQLRNPEFYNQRDYDALKEISAVYTQDLALSGVIQALKRGGKSPVPAGLEAVHASFDKTTVEDLHTDISDLIKRADRWWVKRGTVIESTAIKGLSVAKDIYKDIWIMATKIDDYTINSCFEFGPLRDKENLIGFYAFNSLNYDHDNDKIGLAQEIIDIHRTEPTFFTREPSINLTEHLDEFLRNFDKDK